MDVAQAIDLGRQAIFTALLISSPLLIAGMVVALVIGLLQAVTQVQDQTISFVPKIVAMIVALSLTLPWVLGQLVQYSSELIAGIPGRL